MIVGEATSPETQTLFTDAVREHQAGRLPEATRRYRQILAADPRHADGWHLLGVGAHQGGQQAGAVALMLRAIRLRGSDAAYHCNLGNALRQLGRIDDALAAYHAALRLRPDFTEGHANLGLAYADAGRLNEALAADRTALCLRPDRAELHHQQAIALKRLGRLSPAIAAYRLAVRIKPDLADALYNMGNALSELRRLEEAVCAYGDAVRHQPDFVEAHANLGNALADLRRLTEAVAAYRAALCLKPGFAEVYRNLGNAMLAAGDPLAAIDAFSAALRLTPDDAEAHAGRGFALLLEGRFEAGWSDYEWRWKTKGFATPRRVLRQPLWRGEPLQNRVILLQAEQGLGDAIQFCRYAPMVAARGARVILEAPAPLLRLFQGLPGVDQLVATGDDLPDFDLHCPLLSLPRLFDTGLDRIPPVVPVALDQARVAHWRERLRSGCRRIGIVWQGNSAHKLDRERSLPLAHFARLAALAGVQLISLQKGHGVEQIEHCPEDLRLTRLGPDYEAGDIMETACVLAALDLVITIDSAVAHLAGTIGMPVWVALPHLPDWRWMRRGDDSPWYPTMRLFRQTAPGAWPEVFEKIAAALLSMSV